MRLTDVKQLRSPATKTREQTNKVGNKLWFFDKSNMKAVKEIVLLGHFFQTIRFF